jgi:alcohol dehydrogenase
MVAHPATARRVAVEAKARPPGLDTTSTAADRGHNVGMRGGPAPARHYQPELLKAVLDGHINPGKVFDLTTDFDHIADAYAAMDERRAIKALIKVGER